MRKADRVIRDLKFQVETLEIVITELVKLRDKPKPDYQHICDTWGCARAIAADRGYVAKELKL